MTGAVVLREGDAQPRLLLLHGFAGAPASWRRVAERLDPARGALAVALPGHDPARPLPDGSGFLDAVRSLGHELASAREEAPGSNSCWHLAGYSMGARVGLALLLERPELFSRASLVGLHPGLPTAEDREARRAEDRAWVDCLRLEGVSAFAAAWEARPIFASQASAPPEARAAQRATRRAHDPEQLARALEALGLGAMPDLRPRLPELRCPVTLVVGGPGREVLGARARGASGAPLR